MAKQKTTNKSGAATILSYPQFRIVHGVLFIIFTSLILVIPSLTRQKETSMEPQSTTIAKSTVPKVSIKLPTPAPYPLQKPNTSNPPLMSAKAIIVADMNSATVLYAQNEEVPLWPASTTKLMTALVALDEYPLDEIVTVNNPIQIGSLMGLAENEKITVENLLYGMLIHSANDAAYALARHHPGGITRFVELMNQKALTLHLTNTHFFDPAGFDNEKQYTTAEDLVSLSYSAMYNQTIARMVAIPTITVSDVAFTRFHQLRNVNQLLGTMPGVAGVKTGYTENAKENLINLTIRDNHQILTVVLGSDDRFGETRVLTNWAFDNFEWKDFTVPAS